MNWEMVEDGYAKNVWRVEGIDAEGLCYVSIFSGPLAKERASQYLHFLLSPHTDNIIRLIA